MSTLTPPVHLCDRSLASSVRQDKEKTYPVRKAEIKLALCTEWRDCLCIENPKVYQRTSRMKQLSLIRSQVATATHRNQSYFCTKSVQLETSQKDNTVTRAPKNFWCESDKHIETLC